jgi:2-enoate reductase
VENAYKSLFEPFTIGGLEIKNRLVMAPMGTIVGSTAGGTFTNDAVEYFLRRAKGGIGLIITGLNLVDSTVEKIVPGFAPSPVVDPHGYGKIAGDLTERIHAFGTKIFLQLTAGFGRSAFPPMIRGGEYVAPSPTTNRWDPRLPCRALETAEVEKIVKQMALAATLAKGAGFDGVEIHAMHEGYLLDCFALSLFNQRTDKYGGDLLGRMTFAIEIVQAIKAACGPDFPVVLRFSVKSYVKALRQGAVPGEEFTELGRDVPESLEAAKILENAGYDAFDADAGTYDSWYWAHPPMYFGKGMYLPLTEQLKKVAHVPVIVAGRMDDPHMAVEALNQGKLDAVGLGRALLADPDYPNKVKTGRMADVRPCLGCHDACFGRLLEGKRGSCAVNPECGRELTVGIVPAAEKKTVVVIGGGPAGMEAARVSAMRGYDVTIFDTAAKLGGSLIFAGVPDFKADDRALVAWYEGQLKKLGVKLRMETQATRAMIMALDPDIVYVATGSTPVGLDVSGAQGAIHPAYATEILGGSVKAGKRCTIVGGGVVGCETALYLAQKGKDVTIVEEQEDILTQGSHLPPMNEWMLRDLLVFANVKIMTKARLSRVTDDAAVVIVSGEERFVPTDTVIVAIGYKKNGSLMEELKGEATEVLALGDARRVRNIRAAIWDAYEVARSL